MKSVKLFVPATIANFGPGFDVFGTSVNEIGDVIELQERDEIVVKVEGYKVPIEPERNAASVAAMAVMELAKEYTGFRMIVKKGIRPGGGLGSSGASALGGALAMAKLLGIEDDELIIKAALKGEFIASGEPHGDNIVPAYYGGFTILNSLEPLDVVRIDYSTKVAIILPEVVVNTRRAREILPRRIPRENAVKNIALASSLLFFLLRGDLRRASRYLEDRIAFPYRRVFYPWFDRIRRAVMDAGAYGIFISGSGPALFILGEDLEHVAKVAQEEFASMQIRSDFFVSQTGGRAKCI